MANEKTKASEEQLIYANILNYGMWFGLAVLTISFAMYIVGVLPNYVPINDLPKYWTMKSKDYLFVMSQVEQNKAGEAVALIATCKKATAEGQKPAECNEIAEQGHKMAGWSWLHRLGKGDYLNFIGVALLAGLTIVCYLAIIPTFLRKKDTAYLVIAIVEVVVLTLAASGLMKTGGH
jgi:hypothetical protein